jgi:mono/diheme cytochrome c family protein
VSRASLVLAALVIVAAAPGAAQQKGSPAGAGGGDDFRQYVTPAEYSASDEEGQPDTLPTMPDGMSVANLVRGDSLFHGKGHCFACHGMEATGQTKLGSALTTGVLFVNPGKWQQLDSLISSGIPDRVTRSPIAMPPRGGKSDLRDDEVRDVAAYIWAISQTRGEPWPGGHAQHSPSGPPRVPRTDGP